MSDDKNEQTINFEKAKLLHIFACLVRDHWSLRAAEGSHKRLPISNIIDTLIEHLASASDEDEEEE